MRCSAIRSTGSSRGGTVYGSYASQNVGLIKVKTLPTSAFPVADVGDVLSGTTAGPLDYDSFGGYRIQATTLGAPTDNTVVAADQTYAKLIAAIQAGDCPTYAYRQINPVDDQDGGDPGGNIRVGFLCNPTRAGFTDRAGGTSTTAASVVNTGGTAAPSVSPERINPTNSLEQQPQAAQRHTYVHQGDPQALDHILTSPALTSYAYDIVHFSAEFADQASDHDPQVVRLPP
ncbi:hypothetical protein ACFQ6B_39640 [Streptomyces wedmorensis]|uniref:Uncharacterized protein n=1 Tax=Streptomyces wedmorensis TaxID=43759 RepID=A0ABW6J3Z5_STRWE